MLQTPAEVEAGEEVPPVVKTSTPAGTVSETWSFLLRLAAGVVDAAMLHCAAAEGSHSAAAGRVVQSPGMLLDPNLPETYLETLQT